MITHRTIILADTVLVPAGHSRQRQDCLIVKCSCGWVSPALFAADLADMAVAEHHRQHPAPPPPESPITQSDEPWT